MSVRSGVFVPQRPGRHGKVFFNLMTPEVFMARYRSEKDFLHSLKLFNTLSSAKYSWCTGMSSKEHTCEFGHDIPPEELYFKKPLDSEGSKKIRLCKHCMETLVHIIIDSDVESKQLVESIYKQKNPKPKVISRKARA